MYWHENTVIAMFVDSVMLTKIGDAIEMLI